MSKSVIDRRPIFHWYRRLFGSEDMHSHYRWNAIRDLVDYDANRTLEVGGGDGRMSFEIYDHGYRGTILINEYDQRTADEARRTAELGGYEGVEVSLGDLRELDVGAGYDQVLLIDVLEHIDDDALALRQVARTVRPGGRLVVSVPTPRYPLVFGRRFHDFLGHVRDGYYLEDLVPLLAAESFTLEQHRYYTGRAVSWACRLFYGSRIPYVIGVLWAPLVRPVLMRSEARVGRDEACSLAVVAMRRGSD